MAHYSSVVVVVYYMEEFVKVEDLYVKIIYITITLYLEHLCLIRATFLTLWLELVDT